MQCNKLFILAAVIGAISIALAAGLEDNSATQKVRVQILVFADSSNSLQANIEAPAGTSARDLMERLFKMSYADLTRRFVNGIAGFAISPGEKKFWRLEVDGKASEVGIAEIKISQPMQIRWVLTAYK
jgi:ABC-type oligopeptide transport system substrate-binding subunit